MKEKIIYRKLPAIIFPSILLLIILFFYTSVRAQEDSDKPAEVGAPDAGESAPVVKDKESTPAELLERIEALESELKDLREETEVRRMLTPTEEERSYEAKEILTAAGRQYTLIPRNTLEIEYSFAYKYYSFDILGSIDELLSVEQRARHTLTNSLFIEYALLDNFTLSVNAPFVYKYDEINIGGDVDNISETDIGDIALSFQYQPLKIGDLFSSLILLGQVSLPTGKSPYDINVEKELSTGNGYYSATFGGSMSKTFDPIVTFGSLSYTYNHKEDDIDQIRPGGLVLRKIAPGDSISMSVGLGYAVSYNISMNFSYSYSYGFETKYYWEDLERTKTGTSTGSQLGIGAGLRLESGQAIHVKFNIGLTNEDPDFNLSARVPFSFLLGE